MHLHMTPLKLNNYKEFLQGFSVASRYSLLKTILQLVLKFPAKHKADDLWELHEARVHSDNAQFEWSQQFVVSEFWKALQL